MLKLAFLLRSTFSSRHQLSESLSSGKACVKARLGHLDWSASCAGISSTTGNTRDRIFAPFSIFKGKAALHLSPLLPTFTKLETGAVVVDRRGSVMMSFLPAAGERKYDSQKKQVFALSATELGSLISLGSRESCEFFHDPSMKGSNAGQVRKSLSIKPHTDGSGYFISLTVVNNIQKFRETFTVPVTTAEFAVMKTACSFALPHIMGWDRMTQQQPRNADYRHPSKTDPQLIELEWEK